MQGPDFGSNDMSPSTSGAYTSWREGPVRRTRRCWSAWGRGGGTGRCAIITTVLSDEAGARMYWSCSILPTRFSPSREVPSLGRQCCVEGRATELLTQSAGTREEFRTYRAHKYDVVWDAFCVRVVASGALDTMQRKQTRTTDLCLIKGWLRRSCQSLSAKSRSRYLTTSDKRTQNHGFVVMPAAANSPAVQHETPVPLS
ncbi:hypothetical protein ARMGADRAFT_569532 [Armillaria gallica]|uniref:Uncharacterized protein n=1 Tax=Armillaria gallica TaxID=47427 RepID=A0A2H3DSI7_ARMGA|nr:hypothetical protein ARMGADRAFT_569532 [Armillaria gallica]